MAQKQGQPLIDSLLLELPKAKEDTNKVHILYEISFAFLNIDPDSGIMYGNQQLALAEKLEWEKGIALADNALGINYITRSDYARGLQYYFSAAFQQPFALLQ